jgi:recombinational DNA repair protein (RecF pathway)
MLHFAPPDPHPESYDLFRDALQALETAPPAEVQALGFRVLWHLVSVLGFAPSLDTCVRDGTPLPAEGALPFSTREGGALCPACAADHGATRLPAGARADRSPCSTSTALPVLDDRHGAAHRRPLARYALTPAEAELPALDSGPAGEVPA